MPNLGWYLDKIEAGTPVSRYGLMKAWSQAPGTGQIHEVLDLNVPDGAPIQIRNPDNFRVVCNLFGAGAKLHDRISAARTGQSHRTAVSSSMIPLRSIKHPHPENVVIHPNGMIDAPRALAGRAIIVENLELFLTLGRLDAFCRTATAITPAALVDMEFLFGAGMAITKALNIPFLRQFHEVYCLPDLDVGGLRIVACLIGQLREGSVYCLAPTDLPDWLARYGKAITETEHDALLDIANNYPTLRPIAQALVTAGKKMEQEVYLEQTA